MPFPATDCAVRSLILLLAAVALAGCVEGYEDLSVGPSPHESRGNFTQPGLNQSANATGNVSTNNSAGANATMDGTTEGTGP